MGTIVEISRGQIIKAIRKEPIDTLAGGAWCTYDNYLYGKKQKLYGKKQKVLAKNKNCMVCAVGAVMRNAVLNPFQDAKYVAYAAEASLGSGDTCGTASVQIKKQNWMAALSSFFEQEYWEGSEDLRIQEFESYRSPEETKKKRNSFMKELRKKTIEFVQKNFPKKIRIDIDGAKPAKDVKVVDHVED